MLFSWEEVMFSFCGEALSEMALLYPLWVLRALSRFIEMVLQFCLSLILQVRVHTSTYAHFCSWMSWLGF